MAGKARARLIYQLLGGKLARREIGEDQAFSFQHRLLCRDATQFRRPKPGLEGAAGHAGSIGGVLLVSIVRLKKGDGLSKLVVSECCCRHYSHPRRDNQIVSTIPKSPNAMMMYVANSAAGFENMKPHDV